MTASATAVPAKMRKNPIDCMDVPSSSLRSLVASGNSLKSISGPQMRIASIETVRSRGTAMTIAGRPLRSVFYGLLAIAMLPLDVAPANAQADFRSETVSIQIGYGPGGGYDTYGRV